MTSLWPSILTLTVLVAAMAALPWLLRRLREARPAGAGGQPPRVLGVLGLGPQQRLVTVEVGEGAQCVRLVLGVSAQGIHCLHVLPAASVSAPASQPGFAAIAQDARLQAQGAEHD
ncbi:FliO/MopB family protein [Comamonas composti]|uniref:FliO/MopB family protein n=1 Tax=Comamonas composti TaxID=408558 RepID=UPI000407883D|nr:flagellar biosynthetic protein FliO [Comamonas composti]